MIRRAAVKVCREMIRKRGQVLARDDDAIEPVGHAKGQPAGIIAPETL